MELIYCTRCTGTPQWFGGMRCTVSMIIQPVNTVTEPQWQAVKVMFKYEMPNLRNADVQHSDVFQCDTTINTLVHHNVVSVGIRNRKSSPTTANTTASTTTTITTTTTTTNNNNNTTRKP
jgi:hypothetical protein